MTAENKSKCILKIVLTALISLAVAAGITVGVVFGVRAAWKSELISMRPFACSEQGITISLHDHGVRDGVKYSYKKRIIYSPSRQGLWCYAIDDSQCLFGYNDKLYRTTPDGDDYLFWDVFSADDEQAADSLAVTDYSTVEEVDELIFSDGQRAVDGVSMRGDSYIVALNEDYLIETGFNGIREDSDHSSDGFECTVTAPGGRVSAISLSYRSRWRQYNDKVRTSTHHIDIEVEAGADFSEVRLPDEIALEERLLQGDLVMEVVSSAGGQPEEAYVTPDGAVREFARPVSDREDADAVEVAVYARDGVLAVVETYGVEIYSLPSLTQLGSVEMRGPVADADIAEGRLAVFVCGKPFAGEYNINKHMPNMFWVYIFDLATMAETGRYDIGAAVEAAELGFELEGLRNHDGVEKEDYIFVYDGEDVYIDYRGDKLAFSTSSGTARPVGSLPESLRNKDGGDFGFVECDSDKQELNMPSELYFGSPSHTGYTFGGYGLALFSPTWNPAFALYNEVTGEYDYLFPQAENFFGYGEQFVCSLGGGKYLCYLNYGLFTIDMEKLQLRCDLPAEV